MLRHIYLTNVYKNMPKINQMQDLANEMGHSVYSFNSIRVYKKMRTITNNTMEFII